MKILIVSATDIYGGAGKAAYRLHKSLLDSGVDCTLLVQRKLSLDCSVIGPVTKIQKLIGYIRPYIDNLPVKLYRKRTGMFSISWISSLSLIRKINSLKPDIVHIHWIGAGMIRIEDIQRIEADIVWSLHDMWTFTGGCHYDEECGRYTENCGQCKVLHSSKRNDLSRKVFQRKLRVFSKIQGMTIISTSKWLHDCAKSSRLLEGCKHVILPNPISLERYYAVSKNIARKNLLLPKNDVKLVLFGADVNNKRKNFSSLVRALNMMPLGSVECVVFGERGYLSIKNKFKIHYLGFVKSEQRLIDIYSSSDVLVVSSTQEAFGLTVIEAMACETPVVGFNNTGVSDLIDHKINGYLSEPNDVDLKDGINWVLHNDNYDALCIRAKDKASIFDSKVISKRYIALYNSIITKNIL